MKKKVKNNGKGDEVHWFKKIYPAPSLFYFTYMFPYCFQYHSLGQVQVHTLKLNWADHYFSYQALFHTQKRLFMVMSLGFYTNEPISS
jgi:hypothetical protein